MTSLAAALAVLAILPAGQSLAVPLDGSTGVPAPLAESQCVPPGLPPFAQWTPKHSEPVLLMDELGRSVLSLFVRYEARGQRIHTFWIGPLLAAVDPAPEDRTAPSWYDRGVSTSSRDVRSAPAQSCQWFRPPPIPGGTP